MGWLKRLKLEATETIMVIGKLLGRCNVPALADPDLQIRWGPVIQTLRLLEWGGGKKSFFRPFGPQFGPKIWGGGAGPPGPSPGSATDL